MGDKAWIAYEKDGHGYLSQEESRFDFYGDVFNTSVWSSEIKNEEEIIKQLIQGKPIVFESARACRKCAA